MSRNIDTAQSMVYARDTLGRGKQLVIIVGNIASGKSTITKKLSCIRFMQVLSLDAMRYMLGGGYYHFGGDVEKVIQKAETDMLKHLMSLNYNIIIDDAKSVSRAFREPLISLAKKKKYKVIIIETPTISKKESVERRTENSHGEYSKNTWASVYDKFKNMYNKPIKEEGFDLYIKIKSLDDLFEMWEKVGVK